MTLQEQIKLDMVNAMKSKHQEVLGVLRVISGEFPRSEYYKTVSKDLPDEEVIKILRKMVKNAEDQGNDVEANIINAYLPQMLEQDEILLIVSEIIINNNITNIKEMGKAMGLLKQHPKAALIDNKFASAAIRLQLTKVES